MDNTISDRIIALSQHLNISTDTITEDTHQKNLFIVNERQEKQGTPPSQYIQNIKEFKQLLDPNKIELANITFKINNFLELSEEKQKEQSRLLYDQLEPHIPTTPIIKDALYNTNILYHLLNQHPEYIKAWKNEPIEDTRELHTINDGEYLVLTDEEADQQWDEYLDSYIDDCLGIPDNISQYFDSEAWKNDARASSSIGNDLASYDGNEYEQEVNGTTYYIYRTN